jgi:predicted nucleic acid-binding protein
MKVLIDTNVILDALIARPQFKDDAERLFLIAADDSIVACITASTVTDIYYLLSKYLKSKVESKIVLQKLFALFTILDVTGMDCERAMELPMPDYEDALIAECANRNKIDCIVTRNVKDFASSPVRTLSPADFLAKR